MPAKLVTYNSQNYASTLGSGLAHCLATYVQDKLRTITGAEMPLTMKSMANTAAFLRRHLIS